MDIIEAKCILQDQSDNGFVSQRSFGNRCLMWSKDSLAHEALRVLLAASVMPEHPSDELLNAMSQFYGDRRDYNAKRYEALRAALTTPPKPKMKTVWKYSYTFMDVNHVEEYSVEADANHYHKDVIRYAKSNKYSNVSPIWSEEVEDK
jgi:hypothetical protein